MESECEYEYIGNCCIPSSDWIDLPLLNIREYNYNTSIFSFGLPNNNKYLNLSICSCLLILAPSSPSPSSLDSSLDSPSVTSDTPDTSLNTPSNSNPPLLSSLDNSNTSLPNTSPNNTTPNTSTSLDNIPPSEVIRPYTPISDKFTEGRFDLLIKRYDQWGTKCEPKTIFSYFSYNVSQHAYKPKGLVSNYLFERKVGDLVKVL